MNRDEICRNTHTYNTCVSIHFQHLMENWTTETNLIKKKTKTLKILLFVLLLL